MKNVKISLLTLSVGTSLALGAFAATKTKTPPPTGTNYVLNVNITNTPAPLVASISGTPTFQNFGSNGPYGVVYTDGSGKFDGVEDMIFTNLDMCEFTSGDFITSIGGSISTVGGTKKVAASTVVQMTMKGNGYVQNSTGSTQDQAGLNLTFKGTLFPSNSVVNLTTTNIFLEIGTNEGETFGFTNVYVRSPITNSTTTVGTGYQVLDIYSLTQDTATTTNSSAGTNTVLVRNEICSSVCEVYFGTPIATNTETFFPCITCTTNNPFTNQVVIASNFTYTVFANGSTNTTVTNGYPIYGLDISNLSAYISAVSNCLNTNETTFVSSVALVLTNTIAAVTNGSTNITLYSQLSDLFAIGTNLVFLSTNPVNLTFSNGFYEVDGTLKGQITAGRCKQSFNGTNASFTQSFSDYTTMTGSGANTNGGFFATNSPLGANDSNIFYVVYEPVENNNGLTIQSAFDGNFRATVKQWANSIWVSASGGFIGSGTQNPKKGSYSVKLGGVGYLSGSSLVITGATGIDIVGYTVDTNIVAFTNTAAVPPVVGFVTNSTAITNRNYYFVPPVTVANVDLGDGYYDYFTLTTNGAGTNITVTLNSICSEVEIPPLVITNTVSCIKSVFGNGKVLGQAVSGSGTNLDVPYAEPALPSAE
jgi:hypothetical protein